MILDSVSSSDSPLLREFAEDNRTPIHFLAVARADTPEVDDIRSAASILNADVTLITPDSDDVQSIVKSATGSPRAVNASADGVRWAEAGWWLVPLLAILSLTGFRRESHQTIEKAST